LLIGYKLSNQFKDKTRGSSSDHCYEFRGHLISLISL
jgi:hypothetical protein